MDKKIIIFLSIFLVIVIFRILLFYSGKPVVSEGDIRLATRITSQPKIYSGHQNFSVTLPSGETVFIKTKADLDLNYADRVIINGSLKYRLLNSGDYILVIDNPKIGLDERTENKLLAVVQYVRQQITKTYYDYLPKDMAGLLLGIVTGVKADFSPQFLKDLKTSGVMHVIAASGMNVTLVGGFFFYGLSLILKRKTAIYLAILSIIFYGLLAGFQPSIIRACIMGIILFLSQAWGRQSYSFYSLIVAALLMLLIWPQFIFDIGFQLSFSATLGLLFIPKIFGFLRNILSQDFLTTISAQVATLPILLVYFGNYSVWSIVVNLLLLWTVPILMILGGIAAIFAVLLEPLAKYFLFLSIPLLAYFKQIVEYFSSLPGIINVGFIPISLVLGYYLLLIAWVIYVIEKEKH